MFASGGPPQYDKIDATLVANERVGRATNLLRLESDAPLDYRAGHVLALEVEEDGEWLRGPYRIRVVAVTCRCGESVSSLRRYTVSRATKTTFDVVIRVCGRKSEVMAAAPVGSRWRFGGKFHVPILEGVAERASNVVCLATGTGLGPVLGFAEEALEASTLKLTVLAGFREAEDVCCAAAVEQLREAYPERFECRYVLSSAEGRVSSPDVLASVAQTADAETHFHLIGNGAMVNEWKAGLAKAGVPEDLVTTETYFNHKVEADDDVVDRIAAQVVAAR